jgi:hypothetical protein
MVLFAQRFYLRFTIHDLRLRDSIRVVKERLERISSSRSDSSRLRCFQVRLSGSLNLEDWAKPERDELYNLITDY